MLFYYTYLKKRRGDFPSFFMFERDELDAFKSV